MPSVSETTTIPAPIEEVWPLLSDPALVASCIPGATLSEDQSDGLWRGGIRVKFGPTVAQFRGEASLNYDHTAKTCSIEGKGIDGRGASRALASGVVTAMPAGNETKLKVDGEFSVTGPLETFANAGGVHVARALLGEFSANMAKTVAERKPAGPKHATIAAANDRGQTQGSDPIPPEHAPSFVPSEASVSVVQTSGNTTSAEPTRTIEAVAAAPTTTVPTRPTLQSQPTAAAEISAGRILWLAFKSWLSSLFRKRTRLP
ncbi:MAG: SRPBCC family protein [Hyphomicrobiaceae bacterium]